MIIGIVFVVIWIWCIWEAWKTPVIREDEVPWEEDPEVLDFLERMDEPGPWPAEDDRVFTVGGLTADKDKSFSKFQKKQDKNKRVINDESDYDDVENSEYDGISSPKKDDPYVDDDYDY